MAWILIIALVLWLFGASIFKIAFELIVIVAVVLLVSAVLSAIAKGRRDRV